MLTFFYATNKQLDITPGRRCVLSLQKNEVGDMPVHDLGSKSRYAFTLATNRETKDNDCFLFFHDRAHLQPLDLFQCHCRCLPCHDLPHLQTLVVYGLDGSGLEQAICYIRACTQNGGSNFGAIFAAPGILSS